MKRAGAASAICQRHTALNSPGGFGKSPPLQTFTAVRLSIRFFQDDQPTAPLAVWAYLVQAEALQHDVLLEHDSWIRSNDRSYRTLAPRPGNNRVWGALTLSLSGQHGATAFVPDLSTHRQSFHLLYGGDAGITLSHDHRLIEVDIVGRSGAPALTGCYLGDMLQAADTLSMEEHIVEKGSQLIPLASVAGLKPSLSHYYDCLRRSSCPTPRLLLHFLVTPAHNTSLSRAQLPLFPWMRVSCCPHHSAWTLSFTLCAMKQFRHATNLRSLWPSLHTVPLHPPCSND